MPPNNTVSTFEINLKNVLQLKRTSKILKAINWGLIGTELVVILLLELGIQNDSFYSFENELAYLFATFVILMSYLLISFEFVYFLVMVYLMENSKNILLHFSLFLLILLFLFQKSLYWNILDF